MLLVTVMATNYDSQSSFSKFKAMRNKGLSLFENKQWNYFRYCFQITKVSLTYNSLQQTPLQLPEFVPIGQWGLSYSNR